MAYVVEVICIIAGLAYMLTGIFRYGVWKGITINAGFMPLFCGSIITLLGVLMLISKVKKGVRAEKFDMRALYPVGAMILILICNYFTGLIGACFVVALIWLRFVEKFSWKSSVIAAVILLIATYGIFRMWLNVPFPKGIIGEML